MTQETQGLHRLHSTGVQLDRAKWIVIASVAFLALAVILKIGLTLGAPGTQQGVNSGDVESALTAMVKDSVDANKQRIFDAFHPVGKAVYTTIDTVKVTGWRGGKASSRLADVAVIDFQFSIYWESPLITSGYTSIFSTYDFTQGRLTDVKLLDTNGLTREKINDLAFLAGLLAGEIRDGQ